MKDESGKVAPPVLDHSYPIAEVSKQSENQSKDVFSCILCDNVVDFPEKQMAEHVLQCHDMDWKKYLVLSQDFCHICFMRLEKTLKQHCKEHHPISVLEYFELEGKPRRLKEQYMSASSGHRCSKCKSVFDSEEDLTEHLKKVHSEHSEESQAAECWVCSKKFRSMELLTVHKYKVHPTVTEVGQHICENCHEVFDGKVSFRKHLLDCPVSPVFICFPCNKVFDSKVSHDEHVENHPEKPVFICHLCGSQFNSRASFHNHKKNKHDSNDSSQSQQMLFSCDTCGKTFSTKLQIKRHLFRVHTGVCWISCLFAAYR
jgi:hypothetical protein